MNDIRNKFKEIYAKHFPNSTVSLSAPALSENAIMIVPLLGKDKSECVNGITHNDPFHTVGSVYRNGDGSFDFTLPLSIGRLKPVQQHYAQSSAKVRTRKANGVDEQKLYQVFERHIKALRTEFEKQRDAGNFLELPFDLNLK